MILNGNSPDPAFVRDGGDFFMTLIGDFASLKLGVYTKGNGPLRVKDFKYRTLDQEE